MQIKETSKATNFLFFSLETCLLFKLLIFENFGDISVQSVLHLLNLKFSCTFTSIKKKQEFVIFWLKSKIKSVEQNLFFQENHPKYIVVFHREHNNPWHTKCMFFFFERTKIHSFCCQNQQKVNIQKMYFSSKKLPLYRRNIHFPTRG